MRILFIILTVTLSLVFTSCSMMGSKASSSTPSLTYKQQPYVIGIGDQISIDIWRNGDLSRSVTVRPDGFVTMPLMGDVKAEGRTPEVMAEVVSTGLTTVIRNPEVSVTVDNPVSIEYQFRVRAMGQVEQPVSIAFVEGMTVMDLVLSAGGVGSFGAPNRAILNRLTDNGYQEYRVRIGDILEKGDISTNYPLQPSDILIIPEKKLWRGEF